MKYVDLTLPTPAENLAADEALLDLCDAGHEDEILRFWESASYFVVVGYANKASVEANLPACESLNIPILRRCSGGGTVLQGPGCLNYSLILKIPDSGPLASISGTNCFILKKIQSALSPLIGKPVQIEGHTDLAVDGLKFSGNAQRRKKHHLLFHGTFLLNFDIPLIERTLRMPSKQPDYRATRPHQNFLTNLNLPPDSIKASLQAAWNAQENLPNLPTAAISHLVRERYSKDDWNQKI